MKRCEKSRRREEGQEKRIGVGNSGLWVEGLFVVVGKVVPSLADCDSILFLSFSFLYSYSYFIFHIPFIS